MNSGAAPTITPAVDALLFDFGGVLVDIDFRSTFAAWAGAAGTDTDTIANRWQFGGAHNVYECGQMEFGAYCDHLRAMLEVDLPDATLLQGWMALIREPMPGIRELLAALARQIPLYLFSNTNQVHWDYVSGRFADLLQPFSGIFLSHELGLRKPDAAAFECVAQSMATPARRIAFFDDFEPNVSGARASGLQAFLVKGTTDVVRHLEGIGIRAAGP